MKYFLLPLIFFLSVHFLPAQCGPELAATRADMDARRYEAAIDKLLILQKECPKDAAQIAAMIKETFEMIEGEKERAEKAKLEADQAKQQALIEKEKAEAERDRANRVISRIYFYKGKFGLTMEGKEWQQKYGFINKNGETVIPFEYDEAKNFLEEDGYARVKKGNKKYLLDTTGVAKLLAENSNELDKETEALDISTDPTDFVFDLAKKEFPKRIGQYSNLKIILALRNKLTSLPESTLRLNQLEKLDLRINELSSLPENIGNLSQLRDLNLEFNKLDCLPESFGELSQLRALNLSTNKFTNLPESISRLTNLTELNLSSNKLISLPESIINLNQLEFLNLANNQLSSLPKGITKLSKLTLLFIQKNAIPEAEIDRVRKALPNCAIWF